MFANVMIAFKDIMLKIQGREISGEKRLSVLAQVRSKKRKLGEKGILQNRGESTNEKKRREYMFWESECKTITK